MSKEDEAREAFRKYEEQKKLLDEKAKDLSQKPPGYAAQSWVNCVNASHALQHAENQAITAKYDPIIDKARADGDRLRQQITDMNDQYRDGKISYEEMIKKNKETREALDQVNAVFDEARNARKKELDGAFERGQQRMAEFDKHPAKPPQQPSPSPPKVSIQSESLKSMLADYHKKFQDPWYKANPPQEKEGKLNLSFKSPQDMNDFCREQAAKSDFTLVDGKTNKVMGYSQNGQFYHANGNLVKKGDTLSPGDKTLEQFKIPNPKPAPNLEMDKLLRNMAVERQQKADGLSQYVSNGKLAGKSFDYNATKKLLDEEKNKYEQMLKNEKPNEEQKKHIHVMIKRIEEERALVSTLEATHHISAQVSTQKEKLKKMDSDQIREQLSDLHSKKMSPDERNEKLNATKTQLASQEEQINRSLADVQKMKDELNAQAKTLGVTISMGPPEDKSSFRQGASLAERELAIKMIDINNLEQKLSSKKDALNQSKSELAEYEKNAWSPEKEQAWRESFLKANEHARMMPATTDKRDAQGNIVYEPNPERHDQMMNHIMDDLVQHWKESGVAPSNPEEAQKQVTMSMEAPHSSGSLEMLHAKVDEASSLGPPKPTSHAVVKDEDEELDHDDRHEL